MFFIFTDHHPKEWFPEATVALVLMLKRGHKGTTEQVRDSAVCLDPRFCDGAEAQAWVLQN